MTAPAPQRWLDLHVHVAPPVGQEKDVPTFVGDLLKVLDDDPAALGLVISPDAQWNRIVRDTPGGMERAARFIRDVARRAPERLYPSCLVNPNYLDDALRTMDRCFGEWGFVMLGEMLGYMLGFDLDNEAGERIVRKAVDFGVPVQVHISTSNAAVQGHTSGMGELADLVGIATRVPEAQYILAHFIGTAQADPPPVAQYLDVIEGHFGAWPRNFWAEIRDFNSPGLPEALSRIPHDRLLCGTDWTTRRGPPYAPYGVVFDVFITGQPTPYPPSTTALLGFLREQGLSADTIDDIAFRNATRLLKLGTDATEVASSTSTT